MVGTSEELELLRCGLTPEDALRSATSGAASLLGLEEEVGLIRPGMRADVLVLDGDPLDFAQLADRVSHVFRDGSRVGPRSQLTV
jgi:imidazolonepropionase-like amidohydrolase